MKMRLFITLLFVTFFTAKVVFGQEANPDILSIPQRIGNFLGGASPFIIIGLGILLIFVQQLAKFIGIILLIIGVVRLVLFFIH
ncbi:MAG: hypothetical protein DYG83_05585 [Candidatus Brocadia sp. AMX2]|uniref:Integral membrane protein n=1 Tax=Candidatus Brocadia sinica JPN1 TaxID=1197129 RepID=A0ABQ0K2R3_9BACT|nr:MULTISPECIES: hypothetical protein [Brocadia]MBC6931586.1 hypothetical protein [Candidatus Brocadia sp.]MBL1169227.1 hypothetical protein [Candidatus Brocadia sp. AMX1]MCK6467116.1 hypothetical protein [Candidatus Brocadia sinica]KAA0242468.1 MAG: hypothetical protein EDM70_13955 [Candidatus Brocadia sp. AMX2]MCE7866293.1 hypothetical protein [Candidatus Brocadia sp. AMX2]